MNVVSTCPSATEILYSLDVEPVAVSHACDYPPATRELPTIDVSKVDAEASADRHDQVRAATADGHLYRMDPETIDSVDPDLIVTQGVCGVCAVDDVLVDETLADLDADPDVLALDAHRLVDVFACVEQVGKAVDHPATAEELVAELQDRLAEIENRYSDRATPKTTVIEWMDPVRPAGRWVPDVVESAGGDYGPIEHGQRSHPVDWDEIREFDPRALIVAPCGFSAERTLDRFHELRNRPGWNDLAAVREGRVVVLDGSAYLTRWTPRLVDAAERLASVLHPECFAEPPGDVIEVSPASR